MSGYSLLSREELIDIVKDGVIDAPFENIRKTSIDVRLGSSIMTEHCTPAYSGESHKPVIDLSDESPHTVSIGWDKQDIPDTGYIMEPGSYILGYTIETFRMPNWLSALFTIRSTMARRFINSALSIWINPGFRDSNLVLELHNISKHHSLLLKPGIRIGQVVFLRSSPVPDSDPVIERYSNQLGVTAGRPNPRHDNNITSYHSHIPVTELK